MTAERLPCLMHRLGFMETNCHVFLWHKDRLSVAQLRRLILRCFLAASRLSEWLTSVRFSCIYKSPCERLYGCALLLQAEKSLRYQASFGAEITTDLWCLGNVCFVCSVGLRQVAGAPASHLPHPVQRQEAKFLTFLAGAAHRILTWRVFWDGSAEAIP